MEVRVEKKGQQPKKIDCSRMLVNAGHPMDKKANWCSHGGWFTLAGSLSLCTDDQLASYIKGTWTLKPRKQLVQTGAGTN
jgi:hypothetical protein